MLSDDTEILHRQLQKVIDLQKNGHDQQAITALRSIITQFPGHSRPHFLLGISFFSLGATEEAIDQLSRAIAINPTQPEYHTYLGATFAKIGKNHLAQLRLHEAIRLDPQQPDACFYLSDTMINSGDAQKAIEWLTIAVEKKPDFLEAWNNLGLCYKALKKLPKAEECFQKAAILKPDDPVAHINLAMTKLIMGDYASGWLEYEWRFKQATSPLSCQPPPELPIWNGESLKDKTLLVIAEQGFGDTLQFIRFMATLKNQGAKLVVVTPYLLTTLLQGMSEIDTVLHCENIAGDFDYYCPLLNIPKIFKTTITTIPSNFPYITPATELIIAWQARLPPAKLKVGLVWEGKPLFGNDPLRRRSTSLMELAPLATSADILFVSLQNGEPARQAAHPPPGMDILDLDPQINDFADTAAIIANLDLVISIDTATAHLSGAMGNKTWVLLPYAPDWRWGLDQEQTSWYPNSTLFRQQRPNKWHEPIQQMAALLTKWPKQ